MVSLYQVAVSVYVEGSGIFGICKYKCNVFCFQNIKASFCESYFWRSQRGFIRQYTGPPNGSFRWISFRKALVASEVRIQYVLFSRQKSPQNVVRLEN